MKKNSIAYSLVFMLILSGLLIFVLAFLNKITKPIVDFNSEIELKSKILYIFNVPVDSQEPEKINQAFSDRVEEKDYKGTKYYVLKEAGEEKAYAVPFTGPGLWGTISGYIGVDKDFTKVLGVDFTEQSETPGLGGRISELPYKEQYRDIDISDSEENEFIINKPAPGGNIDAIAGATQTSNFVTDMINKDLKAFIEEGGAK
ncbi:FMN-binding protein [Peptoniphilus catoniae]|uniref:FMN-binding protein n=1 Tax=Peptoniphilus catoniae TaxID=1660341 RepID=UPI0010FE6879|nr:FMN-binding protein [Peptoniphilus catoniae]